MRIGWLLLVLCACLLVGRGFVLNQPLTGHDTAAYYVSQSGYHENMREGTFPPRWHADGRFGYGTAKLQHRPPLIHLLSEPFVFLTDRLILGANLGCMICIFLGGLGMFLFGRRVLGARCGALSAVLYVTAQYFISNLYLRGAWYEIAAYAMMPWVLWTQDAICSREEIRTEKRLIFIGMGGLAWAALICGHPQTAAIFFPVTVGYALLHGLSIDRSKCLAMCLGALLLGLIIASPYWLVFRLEMPFVRMQLYDLDLQSYFRHFLDLRSLVFEPWPDHYTRYTGAVDYLGRPVHVEVRALNPWALMVLLAAPIFWFRRDCLARPERLLSMFFYAFAVAAIALALPLTWGLWEYVRPLQFFNFPWRTLAVAAFCLSIVAGASLKLFLHFFRSGPVARNVVVAVLSIFTVAMTLPRTGGWDAPGDLTEADFQPEAVRFGDGIGQHFHTPRWVKDYPERPAVSPLEIMSGQGAVSELKRGATRWTFTLQSTTSVVLQVNHHYYPGWQLRVHGKKPVKAVPSVQGLMQFSLPRGNHLLSLEFIRTTQRLYIDILGWVGFGMAVGLILTGGVLVCLAGYRRER
ncbi:MAG: hypothetical protein GY703_10025 [Gammaproteobacteria bacterium]|nr:hypothetical protein [Gammaproteobacteria bacterium]